MSKTYKVTEEFLQEAYNYLQESPQTSVVGECQKKK